MARVSYAYLLKRIVISVFVLWVTVSLLFFLLKAMPGNFSQNFISPAIDPEDLQALRERYGLDDPLWLQYLKWMRNYLTLQFGYSTLSPTPVIDMVKARLPRTLVLFGTAFLLQYTVGTLAGINFGWRRGSRTDQAGFVGGLTLYSIPFFWVGWILLFLLAYEQFGVAWFPIGRMTTTGQAQYTALSLLMDVGYHLILPAAALVMVGWAGAMLVMRTSMQEVVDAPYIQTARAKGLPPSVVKYKHAARNALIPVATQAIVGIAFIVDGAVIVESIFSWPGMGQMLINAIFDKNFPVAFAAFFVLAALVILMHLVLDFAYTVLDPRIRFGESQ
ncbi:MAG: ABC transporter permease [Halobacteriaceae archaeon]